MKQLLTGPGLFPGTTSRRQPLDRSPFIGLIVLVVFFMVSGFISYQNIQTLSENTRRVTHTHDVLMVLEEVLSLLKDAESGQRGYVITGNENYLEPYSAALSRIDGRLNDLHRMVGDDEQRTRVDGLKEHVRDKLAELAETIQLRRTQGFEPARSVVVTDRGKQTMDAIRADAQALREIKKRIRADHLAKSREAFSVAAISSILTGLLGVALSLAVSYLLRRAAIIRQRQDFLTTGEAGLSVAMLGDQQLSSLGENILKSLADYVDAHAAAMFVREQDRFLRTATYGVPADAPVPHSFSRDDGLLGRAVRDQRTIVMQNVPEGYLTIGSALGRGLPRQLIVAPVLVEGTVIAVIELGFVHPLDDAITELLDRVSDSIGMAVRSAQYRAHLQNLLEETQRQTEELQAQGEELRVSNEELEEQGRMLKESQVRLQEQQTELEQTNAQLEEQASLLESERDGLAKVQATLQTQARELERASRYKSDFLANMSHELRTPLNSSLILAKLLSDNPHGNLTEEQVRFAETIHSAGNDLLALINDILDLSKIEAGHMTVRPEEVRLGQLLDSLTRTFQPMAVDKGLTFSVNVLPGSPEHLVTDRQRLEQVLKNLLSNALKFTEEGAVSLTVNPLSSSAIALMVTDTGIGIPADQHGIVFEAFRQADGTTSRRFGGTGLGLSISRQLTQLLGGELSLASEPGQGSTFTVTLPVVYTPLPARPDSTGLVAAPTLTGIASTPAPVPERKPLSRVRMTDDRATLTTDQRLILVVEDDESFARILGELAHELDFQCLIATTAEEGIALATQFLPSAIVLDVGLPDHSGLAVLDRLKHDSRTRHIPVHVVSAGDYAEPALALGAVGYMLKPVKRDELTEALKGLEVRLSRRMKRILIVEDDHVQLDSLKRLLGSPDVATHGATSASDCLQQLRQGTFDCMVLDLTLPDASGYSLLETLSREDAYSFPPVIVYTGRDLSADEEQSLRRYSKSIIIKGAKSPERLLDEVTLFLHQVVSELPPEQQKMLATARNRDAILEGRSILVVEDDVRNIFAITSILEPRGATVKIARNGREAVEVLDASRADRGRPIDLVLMDVMMPEVDGLTATRMIRQRDEWKKLPIIMLTAKAMRDDQEQCLAAGANDYMAKPLDVEKLLSLVRVWMPR